jgi:hypothetical protein
MRKKTLFKILFGFLVFSFPLSALYARKVTFPVHGLEVASPRPVPIEAEWDENWFINTEPANYHHGIARIAAMLSEISYVPVEKNPDSNPLIQTYRLLGFKDSDIEWNYILDYTTPITGNNQAAYSFAFKDISTPKGTRKLVFVVLRGTPLSANEWISNINVSDSTKKEVQVHEGFSKTCENLKKSLYDFLKNNKIDLENSYFLITGHSRGGALSNLLGSILADENIIPAKNLFVYTFASPNVSQEEKTSSEKYNFIWNILNAEDIVPSVPPNRNNWKWKKFGQTKILVNYWNCDVTKYQENYVPRMNEYYKKLLLREYSPFKTGPFIQIQAARVLTHLYKNTESYYRSVFGLHNMVEDMFWKLFPEKKDDDFEIPEKKEMKMPFLLRMIQKNVNANIEGGFEYALQAFVDMHACESYLSWLLALNEDEAFSDLGSSQIVIDGSHDCAIYNDKNELLARIINGSIEIYSLKAPIAALPLPNKNVIGFPGNQNLNVIIHKDSLLPTVFSYKIEHYSADGTFLTQSEKKHFYPHTGLVCHFKAGEITLMNDELTYEKLRGKEAKAVAKQFGLKQNLKFKIQPEFSYSSARIFNLGFRTGTQEIYGSVLGEMYANKSKKSYGLGLGLGHQHSLYGKIMLDSEAFARFVWPQNSYDDKKFNFIPSARFSLSYKPRRRFHFFAATVFDLHIDDFNDAAFAPDFQKKRFSAIKLNEKAELIPSLQFGFRF